MTSQIFIADCVINDSVFKNSQTATITFNKIDAYAKNKELSKRQVSKKAANSFFVSLIVSVIK